MKDWRERDETDNLQEKERIVEEKAKNDTYPLVIYKNGERD